MPDFPVPRWPVPNVITPWSVESYGMALSPAGTGIGMLSAVSGVPIAANRVTYFPFLIYEPVTVVKMSYIVGATASGNVDIGIYGAQGHRLVNSGSTAQGTINTLQELDITDTTLLPALYFMAITLSSATGTYFRIAANDELLQSSVPLLVETPGSFGLPATATFASSTDGTPHLIAMGVHVNTLI